MRLYMKQKVFSWGDKFTVKDENEEDKYYVQGEVFSWGKKLHVYDVSGNEVAFIQQKLFTFLPKYHVFIDGNLVAEIVKEFTFLKPKYVVNILGWQVDGKFWEHDYEITENGRPIVNISKEWFTWGDSYVIDIDSSENEVTALAVVLAIDCVLDTQSNSGNTNFIND
ncbi:MAG: hypothetical protein E7266_06140 [Lachnospiraceae bacterium]|nr:hypothetical protein [Lachnospiraceae bacterium]